MKTTRIIPTSLLVLASGLTACGEPTEAQRVAEAFLSTPVVAEAIQETGFTVHDGSQPPDVAGRYRVTGQVDASSYGTMGRRIGSIVYS